jgi:hypothetical protein
VPLKKEERILDGRRLAALSNRLSIIKIQTRTYWGKASVSWPAIHSAVGLVVTAILASRRRAWSRITSPSSRLNEMVLTTNGSMEAIPAAWLRRKVFDPNQRMQREQDLSQQRRNPAKLF